MTNSPSLIVEGAEEAIMEFNRGEISAQELYDRILSADVVFLNRSSVSEFKEKEDINSEE